MYYAEGYAFGLHNRVQWREGAYRSHGSVLKEYGYADCPCSLYQAYSRRRSANLGEKGPSRHPPFINADLPKIRRGQV